MTESFLGNIYGYEGLLLEVHEYKRVLLKMHHCFNYMREDYVILKALDQEIDQRLKSHGLCSYGQNCLQGILNTQVCLIKFME